MGIGVVLGGSECPGFAAPSAGAARRNVASLAHGVPTAPPRKYKEGTPMRSHRSELAMGRRALWSALAASALLLLGAPGSARADDLPTVKIAVGGGSCLCYLPTMLAEQLGNYKKAGVQVELADFKGGSQTLTALWGGSCDRVSGSHSSRWA